MSTLNVFRYSALIAGVVYGFYTDAKLAGASERAAEAAAVAKQQALIAEAKAEYAKLHAPKKTASAAPVTADGKTDYNAVIANWAASFKSAA